MGANVSKYLLDLNSALPTVVAETVGANTTRFVHSLRGLHQLKTSSGVWEHILTDTLGSLRVVTNNAVAVQESRNYGVYGDLFGATGNNQTTFGYTGEPTDGNGLVYDRARYMSPALGQFVSLDRKETFNRYAYVDGNPVMRTDPSGLRLLMDEEGMSTSVKPLKPLAIPKPVQTTQNVVTPGFGGGSGATIPISSSPTGGANASSNPPSGKGTGGKGTGKQPTKPVTTANTTNIIVKGVPDSETSCPLGYTYMGPGGDGALCRDTAGYDWNANDLLRLGKKLPTSVSVINNDMQPNPPNSYCPIGYRYMGPGGDGALCYSEVGGFINANEYYRTRRLVLKPKSLADAANELSTVYGLLSIAAFVGSVFQPAFLPTAILLSNTSTALSATASTLYMAEALGHEINGEWGQARESVGKGLVAGASAFIGGTSAGAFEAAETVGIKITDQFAKTYVKEWIVRTEMDIIEELSSTSSQLINGVVGALFSTGTGQIPTDK